TEIASTHTSVEYAYRLLTEDSPHNRAILKDTILILVPSLNPDGVDIVTQWYRKTLGTPYEGSNPPELYHKYVGHDNNRDWYIFSQPETRHTISKLHNVWHPQIVYDVHQMGANGARLFVPPWLDRTEPMRDIIGYRLVAFDSLLYNAALHRTELLRNFYKVGERQTARTEPWGFVISSNQRDPGATRKLIETLRFGQVEVQAGSDGSAVVSMHQPYSGWAKTLLEVQHYPEDRLYPGGPPKRPYDVTANTLPLLMGVDVKAVKDTVSASGEWQAAAPAAGPVLKASDTDSWRVVNRAWKQ